LFGKFDHSNQELLTKRASIIFKSYDTGAYWLILFTCDLWKSASYLDLHFAFGFGFDFGFGFTFALLVSGLVWFWFTFSFSFGFGCGFWFAFWFKLLVLLSVLALDFVTYSQLIMQKRMV
jgi:hypothetical protein